MNTLLLIGGIGMQEILVIALIVLLLFGGKKIHELMKGIGKGVRSFKDGVNGLEKEIDNDESTHRNPKDNEPSK
ncbi:MAG TPA: twin-arginine translocase TatA/TatE family subunit [Candidatus Caccoplasma intestinavium]|uniref:Sec-independent protein translocase protein TatA n=1 Tax=Candidatus Caccoplasma intestinavium TaxID=2840716 RepID=A0A9D1KCM6_9BACT|nr:twin-arginine translocase TatA/TatE family subunit [Candidatus Caccoplasma intestinavium]